MQTRIPDEVIDEIRKANEIVDVVGEYVQLKKQGRNFFGLCPFHDEKTPSFSVTQDKQIYHCFGCGKGGNVVNFLMEIEGYTFIESITHLAKRSGIKLPEISTQQSSLSEEVQNLLSAHEWLVKFYHHLLKYTKDGKEGLQYFQKRGVTTKTIDLFQLGISPYRDEFTVDFLKKKGFHEQLLIKAGLLSLQTNNKLTDPFKGRVIFPIRNHLGKTVAFGARSINNQEPKYLNSPENELFQKGKMFFNFDLARGPIRKSNEVILLEGYMDVIAAYQVGIKNVIATLGTSLTEDQARLLRRYVKTVIICYDADRAGIDASFKAAQLLRQVGCEVKIARVKDGMDPDQYIKQYGSDNFIKQIIRPAHTYTQFYIQYIKKDFDLSIPSERTEYIDQVVQHIAMIESRIEREYYLQEISRSFNLTIETLQSELKRYRKHKNIVQKDKTRENSHTNKRVNDYRYKELLPAFQNAERQLLAYMLHDISIAEKVKSEIGASFNVEAHQIIATHLYAFYESGSEAEVSLFLDKIDDDQLKKTIIDIALLPINYKINDKELNDYIKMIQNEANIGVNIQQLKEQQQLALQQNDPIKAAQIGQEIISIEKQFKH